MRRAVVLVALATGCFHPSYDHPTCGQNGECPSGLTCGATNICEGGGGGDDARTDASEPDAEVDAMPAFCLGATGGLLKVCFPAAPTGDLTVPLGMLDVDNSPMCSMASTLQMCVIAADTITVPTGTVTPRGFRALVLVATTSVTIRGTVDVAGRAGGPAGARLGGCNAGTLPVETMQPNRGGGGGAGGGLRATGGAGGPGNGSPPGMPGTVSALAGLHGGCGGQPGARSRNQQGAMTGGGSAGEGGGVFYAIAGATIMNTGIVTAAGASGGGGGGSPLTSPGGPTGGGGGGGGSGGLIGLDAPSITSTGNLIAVGGGGGQAGSEMGSGLSGTDPGLSGAGGRGGRPPGGQIFGGLGGDGSASGSGMAGGPPNSGQSEASGGGGGGGAAGYIKVFPMQALGGVVAPPAS